MSDFFPFTVRGSSYYASNFSGNSSGGVSAFRDIFQQKRPQTVETIEKIGTFEYRQTIRFSYYCYDVIIKSSTDIEFICYDMEDNIYGGRGKEFHRFIAKCPTSLTKRYIDNRLLERAIELRECQLKAHEMTICKEYAELERKALGL